MMFGTAPTPAISVVRFEIADLLIDFHHHQTFGVNIGRHNQADAGLLLLVGGTGVPPYEPRNGCC